MIEGTTSNGFHYSIEEDALDDMELLDALVDMDEGNARGYKNAVAALLGEAQRKRLYDFLRNRTTGRVSAKAVTTAFADILRDASNNNAVKN